MGITPYPARKNGLALRYYALAKTLCETCHDVQLRIFPHIEKTWKQEDIIGLQNAGIPTTAAPAYAPAKVTLFNKLHARLLALMPFGKPLSQISYDDGVATAQFCQSEDFSPFDVVLAVNSPIFELYDQLPESKKAALVVCDQIDSPSLHFFRRYQKNGQVVPSKKYEYIKYRAWERKIIDTATATCYISKVDAEFTGGDPKRVIVIPNGIEHSELDGAPLVDLEADSIGFVGDMSYRPNVTGVKWFLDNVWGDYVEANPNCYFYIVGRNPEQSVYDHAARFKNVVVTGSVDNIWSYYKSIKFFVCPLFSGAGLQNKVIEAMFASRPVISSTIANAGVNAIDNDSIVLADTPKAFIDAMDKLRNDSTHSHTIGRRAQQFAQEHFDWTSLVEELIQLLKSRLTQ